VYIPACEREVIIPKKANVAYRKYTPSTDAALQTTASEMQVKIKLIIMNNTGSMFAVRGALIIAPTQAPAPRYIRLKLAWSNETLHSSENSSKLISIPTITNPFMKHAARQNTPGNSMMYMKSENSHA